MNSAKSVRTSEAASDLSSSSLSTDRFCEEDCHYLLRVLEKLAFENVVNALRAQGPLTQYKELLLNHLKAALCIDDAEFALRCRMAANNPYLTNVAEKLNPSYDNFVDWVAAGYDLAGVDLARAKKFNANRNQPCSSKTAEQSSQLLKLIHHHNRNVENGREALASLMQLPKRPFVPERLRRLLQDTELDINGRIDSIQQEENKQNSTPTEESDKNSRTKKAKAKNIRRPKVSGTRKCPSKEPAEAEKACGTSSKIAEQVNMPNGTTGIPSTSGQTTVTGHGESASNAAMESLAEVALAQEQFPIVSAGQPPTAVTIAHNYQTPPNVIVSHPNFPTGAVNSAQQAVIVKQEEVYNNTLPNSYGYGTEEMAIAFPNQVDKQQNAKKQKKRPPKSQSADDLTCDCARLRPFVSNGRHLSAAPIPWRGQAKQPCNNLLLGTKRPASRQMDYPTEQHLLPMSQTYYPQFLPNSKYYSHQSSLRMLKPPQSYGPTSTLLNNDLLPNQKRQRVYDVVQDDCRVSVEPLNLKGGICENFANNNHSMAALSPLQVATARYQPSGALNHQQHAFSTSHHEMVSQHVVISADHVYDKNAFVASQPLGNYATASSSSAHIGAAVNLVENHAPAMMATTNSAPPLLIVGIGPIAGNHHHHQHVPAQTLVSSQLQHPIHHRAENGLSNGVSNAPLATKLSAVSATSTTSSDEQPTTLGTPKNNTTAAFDGASGLDFLASTASLLAPLETAAAKNGAVLPHRTNSF